MRVELTPDQVDLTVMCLEFVLLRLGEDHASGVHHHVARPYTQKRIRELLALFQPEVKP